MWQKDWILYKWESPAQLGELLTFLGHFGIICAQQTVRQLCLHFHDISDQAHLFT